MKHKEAFLNYLKNQKRYSIHTVRSYTDDLEQFYAFLGISFRDDEAICEVSHKLIRNWIVQLMENKLSTRSVNRKISTLKSYFKFLQKAGYITKNPAKLVTTPKNTKQLPSFVGVSQMDILLNNVEFGDDFSGRRNRLIIDMFYHTGMRLSELINLRIVNINIDDLSLKVTGKRNKERVIPITSGLRQSINDYIIERNKLDIDKNEFLFITKKGKKLYAKLVYRIVNNYLTLVTTIDKRSPHIIRHTFATHMLNAGADLNAIKEILGHANLSATQVYTHNTFEKLKAIYKQAHPRA